MRLQGTNDVDIELRPIGYEFPDDETGYWEDRNFLVVAGRVRTSVGSWSFEDPCLLTVEATSLGEWLQTAAKAGVAPSGPDANGEVWPSLHFIEPNIGFAVHSQEAGEVVLRVHFSSTSAPPWAEDERRVVSKQVFETCVLSDDAVRRAADEWFLELEAYPSRGPNPTEG